MKIDTEYRIDGSWAAWPEGSEEEGPYGFGKTEAEAREELGILLEHEADDRLLAALKESLGIILKLNAEYPAYSDDDAVKRACVISNARAAIKLVEERAG